jgi:hypothetical protein
MITAYTYEMLDGEEFGLKWLWDGEAWELLSWDCEDCDLDYLPLEAPERPSRPSYLAP